jgi:two-component system sensor histidine kinase MprB
LVTFQWVISASAILLCVLAAVFVAGATLNPIRQLTSVVSRITSTGELSTIEVQGPSEVAELEQSFNMMMESLAVSRKQQNRLIADAGHELRTPLTSLRTNIELLIADEKAQMLPEGARPQILSDVAAQLGEFTALVNDLVVLSRGDVEPRNLIALDFSEVVSRAIARTQRRGPSMVFDVSLEPIYVMGDAVALERAVTNLLDNAVKYSPQGGVITVTLDADGLVVLDEGPGISDEDIPHIFERFYRSDSSRNTPGTGLGLSIVDHTITAHGGTIEVASGSLGGAKFTVHLPEVTEDEVE